MNLAKGHTRNCCDIDVETEYIVAWVVIVGGGGGPGSTSFRKLFTHRFRIQTLGTSGATTA
jgi:hypothetical protein